MDLSIVIPAKNEAENLADVVGGARAVCSGIGAQHEILVAVSADDAATAKAAEAAGARVVIQPGAGYGDALLAGFAKANGEYVLSMDADLSHPPEFIAPLWEARRSADLVIASRYVAGGRADMPVSRYWLSRILNAFFRWGLGLKTLDLSSGFRLYRRAAIDELHVTGAGFETLQVILVELHRRGRKIGEIPFHYQPRAAGSSNARVLPFGIAYLRSFFRLRKIAGRPIGRT